MTKSRSNSQKYFGPQPLKDTRASLLARLEVLMDVAGAKPWGPFSRDLGRLRLGTLRSLIYRIERALSEAFEDGQEREALSVVGGRG